ncbi:septum site-determining protein MinC [Paraburkholderia caballeronis]|uniref:Probable septum site-determining protein MinC n=1 Tax=Paraburkholderia caballeronis TaxID=416943 RepID=A0A1H7THI5_9BURK|nr:septum site-determining protein MinC [Paraburkholderia caballeronis]PXW18363.1 septum site-determining protein MinC [Paraburkholderia caballeronis]PXW95643.1 septum site-determining protein MinC [Paraburkholderia caballeronis]RAJ91989.1 septum site-determining protein MinC [Paraburkholderia caballeronis]TDV06981.1 septum site-determining protein MinC [Paraburkholderia caballeronis]TDV10960.1 septum site-determining protein MinC [Paraburkholderia caballeronis]
MSPRKSPYFELKSGSVDTLLFVVKTTELDAMRVELTRRFEATPEFFANDVVAIDVRRLGDGEQVPLGDIAKLLESVRMRPVGVVAHPEQHGWAAEAGLPLLEARDRRANANAAKPSAEEPAVPEATSVAAADAAQADIFSSVDADSDAAAADTSAPVALEAGRAARAEPALIVDRPLRSGQRIYAKGDVVVLGLVSNGAEVIAEGNIHIYAPLRGRALAGVHGNHDARIFCTCLEAELISIAGIYRTTENPLPADVHGKPVQIRLDDDEKLLIEPLRLT